MLVRLNSNGTYDTTFNGQGYVITNFGGFNYFTGVVLK